MRKDYERMIQRVLSALSSGEYLMGKQFSSVDILMSSPFQWIRDFGPPSREIDGWLERLAARPAAQRAEALDRQPSEE
jgi:glutathione S-transferase